MAESLDPLMRRTLALALEAYHAGSFPVGAVLADDRGSVVIEGRNRIHESVAPAGRLRQTALAHAELDVLAQLPLGDYRDHVLYTSLEPCLLCRAAATMGRVGIVRFLAPDPVCIGLDQIPEINEHARRLHPIMEGPGNGIAARFATVLPIAVLLRSNRDHATISCYRRHAPEATAVAERMIVSGQWPRPGGDLDDTLGAFALDVWPDRASCA
jgi:tRNA(Arg) A34 adenosine deaminase TadA